MKKRKVLYISGTRADYGLMRQTLFAIKKHRKLKIEIVATGMHLMKEFGETINEIKKDKFKIHKIKAIYEKDDRESIALFLGALLSKLTRKIKQIKPDIILVMGDRIEMLGGAIMGAYLTVPTFHIHGGEVTSTIDENARHAITKLSHIHLAATKNSAKRIIKMGEDLWRVHVVGAPGLDAILNKKLFSQEEITKKYKLDLSYPLLIVVQHPVTEEVAFAPKQMKTTMESIRELGFQSIVLYPNADPGGREMIKVIEKYRKYPLIQIYKTVPHKDYLSLMKVANAMVGNSSSGIIEAPSFHLPFVNIGRRQEGRERAGNIIDISYNKTEIKRAIEKALFDKKFKERTRKIKNPYGDGKTGPRIATILSRIKIDKKLLHKKISY